MPAHVRPGGALRRRLVPSVPLQLHLAEADGSILDLDLQLAFDFNAVAFVEELAGQSLLAGEIWNKVTGTNLSVLFWASLLAHQPEYQGKEGLEIVRSYMDAGNAAEITRAVTEAFIISLPFDQQEALRAARPFAARTAIAEPLGSTSGPSPGTTSASATTNSDE